MKNHGLTATRKAYAAVARAEKQLHDAVLREMPVGAAVVYTHGQNRIRATVIDHDYGDRVKVRGETGREYWLGASRVAFVSRRPATD